MRIPHPGCRAFSKPLHCQQLAADRRELGSMKLRTLGVNRILGSAPPRPAEANANHQSQSLPKVDAGYSAVLSGLKDSRIEMNRTDSERVRKSQRELAGQES